MAFPDLKRARPGDRLQDPLLIMEVQQKSFGADKECTVLTLGNASGSIDSAPFWGAEQQQLAGIERGHVAQIIGEVGQYRGKRQLTVTSIRVLPREGVELLRRGRSDARAGRSDQRALDDALLAGRAPRAVFLPTASAPEGLRSALASLREPSGNGGDGS